MRKLRWSAMIIAMSNALIIILGITIIKIVKSPSCRNHHNKIPMVMIIVFVSCIRVASMIPAASIQRAMALSVIASQSDINLDNTAIRNQIRTRYRNWLCWTRFTLAITMLQLLGAFYVVFATTSSITSENISTNCVIGLSSSDGKKQRSVLFLFISIVVYVPFVQCIGGPHVLRWRSFYKNEEKIWKAHYQEVFDHGIREALCCMGQVKYLSTMEEDEVYSVAKSLGELVSYRAASTGHLEILAGLALLQKSMTSPETLEDLATAPDEQMQEATMFHPFAEAAYTGVLLDLGRHPLTFPCMWLYRQGLFYPWSRDKLPILQGDNYWRGHAKAFLKFVNLKPDVLRKGRINQGKCKATYFIVVLHDLQTVVIAVRGTEIPDDLITDGLCRECELTSEDLDGLINCSDTQVDKSGGLFSPVSSSAHYGHAGVVEATRDLYTEVEGVSETGGFLSTLLKQGCECEGYNIKIVGHSLGGSIAALLGIRLRRRFPKLHVYSYGPLPCIDLEVANACSDFITSIVYDNEFSSRLSVASILRLQAAAVEALSEDGSADSTSVLRLARHLISHMGYIYSNPECPTSGYSSAKTVTFKNDESPRVMEAIDSCQCASSDFPEVYLPGLIIHILPQEQNEPIWRRYTSPYNGASHKAYLVKRDAFKEIVVSPYMFLDHLPWRCYRAMKSITDITKFQAPISEEEMV